jgi:hypothetical protein
MTHLGIIAAAVTSWVDETTLLVPLVLGFLLAPNLHAFVRHGTVDLLQASGYTIETWTEERRRA